MTSDAPASTDTRMHGGWGGARANAGGARANSGGARPGAGRKPKPPPLPPPDVARWYCVRTHLHGELTADTEIRLTTDFVVLMPTLFRPAEPPRRTASGALCPGKPDRVVPLFPRYLFTQFRCGTDNWRRIRYLPGVECFIGPTSELPAVVPDQAIDFIRGLLAPNLCLYPPTHYAAPFPIGTMARLTQGPMADMAGICTWSDGRRIRLLVQLLGRPVSVTAAQTAVEAA